jgi:hypothetical protein
MRRRITRILLWTGGIGVVLVVAGAVFWIRTFHHYPPKEIMKDVRAGLAARHIREPQARVETFLESRYGPLTDPANRETAFLGFFDVDHINGLTFIVSHTPAAQKQANTQAMADWIANYRATMSSEERAALQSHLNSASGQAMLQRATAQYQRQDVYFRANQKPVIAELMTTLAELRKP